MVNKNMNENNQLSQPVPAPKPEKRPDDTGRVGVEGFVKIFDPNSRKVFVEQQA
jgi:hypothetical protein